MQRLTAKVKELHHETNEELHDIQNDPVQFEVKKILLRLLSASLALILEFLLFIASLSVQGYILLGIGMGGIIIVLIRYIFIGMCLGLLKISTFIVDLLNIVVVILNFLMPMVVFVINQFISAFDDIARLIPLFHSLDIPTIPAWTAKNTVSKAAFTTTLNAIPLACTHFITSGEVLVYFVQMAMHTPACAAVRYLYPDPWAYAIAQSSLSWMYRGSAKPDMHDPRANCAHGSSMDVYETICASLGIGYVMIWVFLPMAIFLMYLMFSLTSLGQLVGATLQLTYKVVVSALAHMTVALDSL